MIRALLFAIAFLFAAPAMAVDFPPLSGRVVDQADLLNPAQEQQLTQQLEALQRASSRQLVVATVSSLQDLPIEDYGYQLGRKWGLGDKKANDGLLLLVAPNERKVRIEVGYGLEPIVTDALSSVIIQRNILPRFRDKDMAGGILAGSNALVQLLQLPPDQARAQAAKLVAEERQKQESGPPLSLIFWIIVLLFIFGSSIANRFGGGRRYRRGGGPVILWGPGWGGGGGGWGGGSGGGWGGGGSFGGGGSSGSW